MKRIALVFALLSLFTSGSSFAASSMDHGHNGDSKSNNFMHKEMVDDLHTEFQIMDLASMNMKDPDGNTHHVMVMFKRGSEIAKEKGLILAANFTIDEPGKWGVICLFQEANGKHTVKFWYPHMAM